MASIVISFNRHAFVIARCLGDLIKMAAWSKGRRVEPLHVVDRAFDRGAEAPYIHTYVQRLRPKLNDESTESIETMTGIGYIGHCA